MVGLFEQWINNIVFESKPNKSERIKTFYFRGPVMKTTVTPIAETTHVLTIEATIEISVAGP